jgi:hypothetical protein
VEVKLRAFLILALNEGKWSAACCGHFTSGKTLSVPMMWEAEWLQSWSENGGEEKIPTAARYQASAIQIADTHFTD